MNTVFITKH